MHFWFAGGPSEEPNTDLPVATSATIMIYYNEELGFVLKLPGKYIFANLTKRPTDAFIDVQTQLDAKLTTPDPKFPANAFDLVLLNLLMASRRTIIEGYSYPHTIRNELVAIEALKGDLKTLVATSLEKVVGAIVPKLILMQQFLLWLMCNGYFMFCNI